MHDTATGLSDIFMVVGMAFLEVVATELVVAGVGSARGDGPWGACSAGGAPGSASCCR